MPREASRFVRPPLSLSLNLNLLTSFFPLFSSSSSSSSSSSLFFPLSKKNSRRSPRLERATACSIGTMQQPRTPPEGTRRCEKSCSFLHFLLGLLQPQQRQCLLRAGSAACSLFRRGLGPAASSSSPTIRLISPWPSAPWARTSPSTSWTPPTLDPPRSWRGFCRITGLRTLQSSTALLKQRRRRTTPELLSSIISTRAGSIRIPSPI